MKAYLKVKIKSLAAEAILIRQEEQRIKRRHRKHQSKLPAEDRSPPPAVFFGLKAHRTYEVRNESRAANLAYGFLRGRAYVQMEAKCLIKPNWKRVEALVTKYGQGDIRDRMQRFSEWKSVAEA